MHIGIISKLWSFISFIFGWFFLSENIFLFTNKFSFVLYSYINLFNVGIGQKKFEYLKFNEKLGGPNKYDCVLIVSLLSFCFLFFLG